MHTENYAIVNAAGMIVNIVVWDGVTEWTPPEGLVAIQCENNICAIGGNYNDGVFTPPPEPEKTPDEIISEANREKSSLLIAANSAITPLQDAVDLGMATDAEAALLTEWRKYRVLLNRVDTSLAPDIVWPTVPE